MQNKYYACTQRKQRNPSFSYFANKTYLLLATNEINNSSYGVIVRVMVVLKRTVVGD